ncbi:MAG: tyrosine-type recombinase/integrase [Thermoplasmatales archaeon]
MDSDIKALMLYAHLKDVASSTTLWLKIHVEAAGILLPMILNIVRSTYATELLKQGVSVYYVSRLLGHEDLSSTQVYLHPSQDAAIQEAKKVRFFLGQNPAGMELMLRPGFVLSGYGHPYKFNYYINEMIEVTSQKTELHTCVILVRTSLVSKYSPL